MCRIVSLLAALLITAPSHAAVKHAERYHWKTITCGGGTVDVFLSIATSLCLDRHGNRYVATYAGGGWGGIVGLSAFTFTARLKGKHDIAGHYTGSSTSLAYQWGAGAGFFKRNDGDNFTPTPSSDEFVLWFAIHRGFALDFSGLTLMITRH